MDVIYTGEKENVSGAVPGLDSFCPFFTPDLYLSYQRWVPRYLPTRQLDRETTNSSSNRQLDVCSAGDSRIQIIHTGQTDRGWERMMDMD